MSVATFTKSGNKAATAAKLDNGVFGVEVKNHELLKQAYLSYLADARNSHATAKTRGLISGGGRKPWRQKGTGNARVGSSRNPIWRGGGIVFGPTGNENHEVRINLKSKRMAIRQALTLASKAGKIIIIESIDAKDGKTKTFSRLLEKIGASKNTLVVVPEKTPEIVQASRNLANVKLVSSNYLSVFSVLNADHIVITSDALKAVQEWLISDEVKK